MTYLQFPVKAIDRFGRRTDWGDWEKHGGDTRSKVMPPFLTEVSCLSLLFATLITALSRWRRGRDDTPEILTMIDALQAEQPRERRQRRWHEQPRRANASAPLNREYLTHKLPRVCSDDHRVS